MQKEEILKKLVITIDGPAGSGKSTTASLLADRLGLTYLDTGAMYRAVAFAVLREGIDPADEDSVTRIAETADIELMIDNRKPAIHLDGNDVSREIRGPDVSRVVSQVSRYSGVRKTMVTLQRKAGAGGGVVVEGRDTGSVVFPYAHVKIFLVADLEARAQRRHAQLGKMGINQGIEDIRENISSRDVIDSSRDHSPLLKAPGAVTVDTTKLSVEEQVSEIERQARTTAEKLADLAEGPGKENAFAKAHLDYRIIKFAVRLFYRLLFGLKIYGQENLKYRENFIFASNHLSLADPPVVGCSFDREVWYMAKKELFQNRFFGWLIRTVRAFPVDRDDIDRKTLKIILGNLKQGDSVLMFPEGTRSRDGSIGQLKSGMGFIAMQADVSILPVYVKGTDRLSKCFLRRERLEVRLGPPIRIPEDYVPDDRKRDYQVLSSMVRHEMQMLKGQIDA